MSDPTQPYRNNPGGQGYPNQPTPGYYQRYPVPPGYHLPYPGEPGYSYPGMQPSPIAPERPKEVTRAFWLLIFSAILQVTALGLTFASVTGSTNVVSVAMLALLGSVVTLAALVGLAFFLRAGFRFARIAVTGVAGLSLLGAWDIFAFGPAAGVVSLLSILAFAGAVILLFQKPSNDFYRAAWAVRRARLLPR